MIVFRQKYPRWWFDWNVQLLAFSNRVYAYIALMSDQYPSTDEEQYVHLSVEYPDAAAGSTAFSQSSSGSWRFRTTLFCFS
jgi:hypothetical protein